jgi:hypothetical protein
MIASGRPPCFEWEHSVSSRMCRSLIRTGSFPRCQSGQRVAETSKCLKRSRVEDRECFHNPHVKGDVRTLRENEALKPGNTLKEIAEKRIEMLRQPERCRAKAECEAAPEADEYFCEEFREVVFGNSRVGFAESAQREKLGALTPRTLSSHRSVRFRGHWLGSLTCSPVRRLPRCKTLLCNSRVWI